MSDGDLTSEIFAQHLNVTLDYLVARLLEAKSTQLVHLHYMRARLRISISLSDWSSESLDGIYFEGPNACTLHNLCRKLTINLSSQISE